MSERMLGRLPKLCHVEREWVVDRDGQRRRAARRAGGQADLGGDRGDRCALNTVSLAITGTPLPPAEASTTIARRNLIAEPVPRLVIRSSC
ncbi:hypothetical protein ABZS66_38155 [Dactylosporangium sp. NPDC005572]|uniref:hypothetical protein n=1 Tax=Dactylosporangium sp. NPDC005572 TaxID=3156889 RepID=UPI00339F4B72